MSKQASLTSYFNVTKRPVDQHPAKRRKVQLDLQQTEPSEQESTTFPSTTSVQDDHSLPDLQSLVQTPQPKKSDDEVPTRNHKRDSFGVILDAATPKQDELSKEKAFTVGKKSVNKRLEFGEQKTTTTTRATTKRRVAKFSQKGLLSPKKYSADTTAAKKNNVPFEFKSSLSPQKDSPEVKTLKEVKRNLNKLTPAEIKAKLGKVNKLSDLKERFQSIRDFKVPPPLSPRKEGLAGPALSKGSISLGVALPPSPSKLLSSPSKQQQHQQAGPVIKASPRKLRLEERLDCLSQPTKDLPIPSGYRTLAEFFRTLDNIVAISIKSRDSVSLTHLQNAIEKATKRAFRLSTLKQVHCVFPKAYKFDWKKEVAIQAHKVGNYELHLHPNLNYDDLRITSNSKGSGGLNPKELVLRKKIFLGLLLRLVKDHHSKFLKELDVEVNDEELTSWHRDFDVESCPEIDQLEFPPQPESLAPKTVTDFIQTANDIFGVNKRLADALAAQAEREKKSSGSESKGASAPSPIKIKKGMEKMPPALLEKILAKEKAKQVKEMTENVSEKNEKTLLKDLVEIAPKAINCYKTESHRQSRKGLETKSFFSFCAKSNAGLKSEKEMEKLIRHFVKIAPEYFEFITIRKTEFIKETGKCKLEGEKAKLKLKKMLEEKEK